MRLNEEFARLLLIIVCNRTRPPCKFELTHTQLWASTALLELGFSTVHRARKTRTDSGERQLKLKHLTRWRDNYRMEPITSHLAGLESFYSWGEREDVMATHWCTHYQLSGEVTWRPWNWRHTICESAISRSVCVCVFGHRKIRENCRKTLPSLSARGRGVVVSVVGSTWELATWRQLGVQCSNHARHMHTWVTAGETNHGIIREDWSGKRERTRIDLACLTETQTQPKTIVTQLRP